MANPNAAQAIYPHLGSSTPAPKQQQPKPSTAAAMYRHLPSTAADLRAREREALWNGAVEAGIKMQARERGR